MPATSTARLSSHLHFVYHFHLGLSTSELLQIAASLVDGKLVYSNNEIACDSCSAPSISPAGWCGPRALDPFTLAVGDALSMNLIHAKFNTYTRATTSPVDISNIAVAWRGTQAWLAARLAEEGILYPFALSTRAPVVGAFVERATSSLFFVGIITQCPIQDGSLVPELVSWRASCSLPDDGLQCNRELPMCHAQRQAYVGKATMDHYASHVVVGEALPPIHAKILPAQTGTLVPSAFDRVRLMLVRPTDGTLVGPTEQMCCSSRKAGEPPRRDWTEFNGIVLDTPGEVLLALEWLVKAAYAPFVEPLSHLFRPFLVVEKQCALPSQPTLPIVKPSAQRL